ncbi:MAG: branched-chain amino acid transaminase [Dehalococcoidales bacterium]|jgi:branched-chain amino acid aminotransferase|nr:branched-chain amino acid transaminase [Dehalococcoidales bacterium]MDP6632488.1 branched-chain amino acid transaminase [Dehalococcoidales bacterium]
MPLFAFYKNEFVPLSEANMSVMTNFIHYGTGVFEGIRGNWNAENKRSYLFCLKEHYERLHQGCQVLKMELPYSVDEMCRITVELVEKCGFEENVYIRPLAYKSAEALGVRLHDLECDFTVFAFPWGPYLPDKVRCCVSSWRFPNGIPRAKLTGLYVTNALAKTDAIETGFDEAIMLTSDGYVAEGSGENIFLVINGELVTPASYDGILMGITRNKVMELAEAELGIKTVERHVDRVELYNVSECFLTGTAANITPVSEIDNRRIGDGEIGQITEKLQNIYSDVIRGNNPKYLNWCTPAKRKGR